MAYLGHPEVWVMSPYADIQTASYCHGIIRLGCGSVNDHTGTFETILSHEFMHYLLEKIESEKTSLAYDWLGIPPELWSQAGYDYPEYPEWWL